MTRLTQSIDFASSKRARERIPTELGDSGNEDWQLMLEDSGMDNSRRSRGLGSLQRTGRQPPGQIAAHLGELMEHLAKGVEP